MLSTLQCANPKRQQFGRQLPNDKLAGVSQPVSTVGDTGTYGWRGCFQDRKSVGTIPCFCSSLYIPCRVTPANVAAWLTFPPLFLSRSSRYPRSARARTRCRGEAPSVVAANASVSRSVMVCGKSPTWIRDPVESAITRSMTFRSSRTFPGHE